MPESIDEKVLRKSSRRIVFLTSAFTTVIIIVFYVFTTWSVGFTSSVDFCTVQCHEMVPQLQEWKTSSHFNNDTGVVAECADCHLPRGFLPKIKAKIFFGVRDSYVHYFGDPENIDRNLLAISAAESITDGSCKACHKNLFPSALPRGGFMAHSRYEEGEKLKCVKCHKNMAHQNRINF